MYDDFTEGVRERIARGIRRLTTRVLRARSKTARRAGQVSAVVVASFVFASAYAYFGVYQPSAFFPIGHIITVPSGASVRDTAELLYREQVVRSPLAFRALFKFGGTEAQIRAGDYVFDKPLTLSEVAMRVMRGEYGLEPARIVIPEGATTYEMADLFAAKFERFDPVMFLMLAEGKEGYLFPDTYFFLPNVQTTEVVETMERTFYERLATLDETLATFGRPVHEIVTMASLLEKEARNHEERREIAGVLWHRLSIDMPLQVDAVFGYIKRTGTFNPKLSDLEVDSPYNTYKNRGLPPGPIGNPSLSSLEAALTPVPTEALYYLHGRDGVMRLANTYAEHLANRRMYLD
jgi:UPF0755 protein